MLSGHAKNTMNLTLRQFQANLITSARKALRVFRRVLIQAPTGAGKTVIATFIAASVNKKGKRLYFICHRQELILQTAKTFAKNGLSVSYIANGYSYNPMCKIQICSIDTLKNRYKKLPPPDMCVWDECHHMGALGWSKVMDYYDKAFHIGLTATPHRLDGKGLRQWFDDIIIEISVAELIELGYLSDYIMYAPSKPDFSQVHTTMGDYNKTEVAAIMDTPHLTGDIIKHWKEKANGMKTVVFAINVNHSKHIVELFNAAGVKAIHLDGDTPRGERREACLKFAQGEYDVVSNVALFGEGFDLSAQTDIDVTIECVISARPTQSLSLWLQMCGRALRKKDYKAIILDHAGNLDAHGFPCDDRDWSLEGNPKQGKRKNDEADIGIKECPECHASHKPGPVCPNCGFVYKVVNTEILHIDGELEERTRGEIKRDNNFEQVSAGTIVDLIALGKKRGYKNPSKWASHVYTARLAKEKRGRV